MPRDKGKKLSLPHQAEGTAFLRANKRAALFDEQGLGKSKQLIDAMVGEIADGSLAGALIICPNGLKSNWASEIESFCSLPYAVFGSGRTAKRAAFGSLRAAFYVINYEAVDAELPSLRALLRFKPMALVLDESHRIKTPDARVTKAVLQLRAEAKRRVLMTGTPVANRPEDLWSQFLFLDDGLSLGGTFDEFKDRYCASGGGYKAVSDLRDRVSALSLRRLKEGTVDLPAKAFHRVYVDMQPRQAAMYDELRNELALWVSAMDGSQVLKQAEAILARLVRLAQLASNPALIDAGYEELPAKFLALDALLDTYLTSPQQKLIVWTSFTDNIAALKQRYASHSPVTIYGAMTTPERDEAVRRFRHDPDVKVLVANPAAAREGLTLTEANVAIYLDRTFNLVDYLQSQDRIHRISQKRPCEIILLIANASVDEFIDFSLEQKHRLAKYAQMDSDEIAPADLALEKPDVLRALMSPEEDAQPDAARPPRAGPDAH